MLNYKRSISTIFSDGKEGTMCVLINKYCVIKIKLKVFVREN